MARFQRKYQENTSLLYACKYIVDLVMVILCAYVLVLFICTRATAAGNSMEGRIHNEDTVLINQMSYAVSEPQRYDCIAFEPDSIHSSKIFIKRIIALPGETVQIKGGRVYVNDNLLEDDVVDTYILTPGSASSTITLKEDEYFCLGDNRNNSEDSRFASIGMVKRRHIIGKVWMVIHPFSHMRFVS